MDNGFTKRGNGRAGRVKSVKVRVSPVLLYSSISLKTEMAIASREAISASKPIALELHRLRLI